MIRRPSTRALLTSAALVAATMLAGCNPETIAPTGRANAPLSDKLIAEFSAKSMDATSPILVRLFKEEAELEVWKKNTSGEYALLKTYPICRWSGDLGPKVREGDRQAPEGFYTITPGQMNPNSNYYLAFNTGYPNAFDRSHGRTGSELMVHGDCSSRGCYAMTDEQMVEIYALARESFFGGQRAFQLQAYPFRMTAANMAKHRNSPHLAFWKMLKVGYDHFDVTHQEPKVDVCDKHYVFDAAAPEGDLRTPTFRASAKCPAYRTDPQVASLVSERQRADAAEYASLVGRNVSVVASRTGVDGGMNPVFYAALNPTHVEGDSNRMPVTPMAKTPGALPREPHQPPAQVVLPAKPQIELASAEPVAETEPLFVAPANSSGGSIGGLIDSIFGSKPEPKPIAGPVPVPPRTPAKSRTMLAAKPTATPTMRTASAPTAPTSAAPAADKRLANAAPPELRPQIKDDPKAILAREMRTAYTSSPTPAPSNNLLSGAQPVVPTGSFENRWSGFR